MFILWLYFDIRANRHAFKHDVLELDHLDHEREEEPDEIEDLEWESSMAFMVKMEYIWFEKYKCNYKKPCRCYRSVRNLLYAIGYSILIPIIFYIEVKKSHTSWDLLMWVDPQYIEFFRDIVDFFIELIFFLLFLYQIIIFLFPYLIILFICFSISSLVVGLFYWKFKSLNIALCYYDQLRWYIL